mmetsp:Transcript_17117/g.23964  ORF Transcript_17117/g.23964 Transcript_17117/m.23964 type:complete len:99 (+) Transcript_17117:215-511(+)
MRTELSSRSIVKLKMTFGILVRSFSILKRTLLETNSEQPRELERKFKERNGERRKQKYAWRRKKRRMGPRSRGSVNDSIVSVNGSSVIFRLHAQESVR